MRFQKYGFLLLAAAIGMQAPLQADESNNEAEEMRPILFEATTAEMDWRIINDTVMGGVSSSRWEINDAGNFVFSGDLSLENNGGFASVRSVPADMKLDNAKAIRLRVRGDGHRYQLRFRTNDRWDGVAYRQIFETTANEWVEVELAIDEFVPTFRGFIVEQAPKLDPAKIRQIGFMITDKQEGTFALEVDWVAVVE